MSAAMDGVNRLLRFLSESPAECGMFAGTVRLKRADGREMLAGKSLDEARALSLVEGERTVAITSDGRKRLARLCDRQNGFRNQHRELRQRKVRTRVGFEQVSVNVNESPLGRLATRKDANGKTWLDEAAFDAGERLRADYERAHRGPKMSASWDPTARCSSGAGGNGDRNDGAIDAGARYEGALATLSPDLAGVVQDVCCHLKGLELVERERRWPPRSAKLVLRIALDTLAVHYRGRRKRRAA